MKLSPLDIQQQQFALALRGYQRASVHQFLEAAAEQMMELMRENNDLKQALQLCEQQRDSLHSREEEIKGTMLIAQRAVDELRGQAVQQAQLVVQDAELRAEKILLHAQGKLSELSESCQDLQRERVRFEEELRGLINTYARLLDVRPQDTARTLSASHATVMVLDRLRPPTPPSEDNASFAQTS